MMEWITKGEVKLLGADGRHGLSVSNMDEILPDELLAKVFAEAGFPLVIAQTCKRWHRLYFKTFHYSRPTIEWLESVRNRNSSATVFDSNQTFSLSM